MDLGLSGGLVSGDLQVFSTHYYSEVVLILSRISYALSLVLRDCTGSVLYVTVHLVLSRSFLLGAWVNWRGHNLVNLNEYSFKRGG